MQSAFIAPSLAGARPLGSAQAPSSKPSESAGTGAHQASRGRRLHIAAGLTLGLALTVSACAPDTTAPPAGPPVLSGPSMKRVSGVTTTTIIPVVPVVPPPVPNTPSAVATAINEAGVVAGWLTSPTEVYAFTWKDGVMTSLGTAYPLRNENLQAVFRPVAINRAGDVAGNTSAGQAVVWRDGTLTTLAAPGGRIRYAYSMNDRGQIVGSGWLPGQGSAQQAFLWEDGTFTELGTLGGTSSVATAINNRGQVVGYSKLAGDAETHAFLWERGVMTDLGTMEGGTSQAFGINDKGEVVGLASRAFTAPVPFLWRNGVMRWMLPGPISSTAAYTITDISDAGHVVGYRSSGGSDSHAFVWRDGVDLDVGIRQTYAMAVNSAGEIAGYQSAPVGLPGAYLWTVGRKGP